MNIIMCTHCDHQHIRLITREDDIYAFGKSNLKHCDVEITIFDCNITPISIIVNKNELMEKIK